MPPTPTKIAATTRIFSSAVFRELAEKGRSALFIRLVEQAGIHPAAASEDTVADVFDRAFTILRKSNTRNEYIYRAALTKNILLGRHSLRTASMLTEFRSGSCKADIVILNGTATVYEIKSERDNLYRLENQVKNYQKIFSKIFIVAAQGHSSEILKIMPPSVGLLSLTRWNRISTVRDAIECSDFICPQAILESLRHSEAGEILKLLGLQLPKVPNTQIYDALYQIYKDIDPIVLQNTMINVLKSSRNLAPLNSFVRNLPSSLQPAALSIQLRKSDHDRLINAISTPFHVASSWV